VGASSDPVTPSLHVVAGDREAEAPDFRRLAHALYERCGPALALHLRLTCSARELHAHAVSLADAGAIHGGWCVVNGRLDVALAAGAQAVQLGRTAIGVEAAARAVAATGSTLRLGASVHGVPAALAAATGGANYLILGTIFATPSHPDQSGAGPELVARVRLALDANGFETVPVLAIGGVNAARAQVVRRAGAYGVAVQRAVWASADPVTAAADLCAKLNTEDPGRA
jgi:thiamine-phosphate diphosphorylase